MSNAKMAIKSAESVAATDNETSPSLALASSMGTLPKERRKGTTRAGKQTAITP